MDAFKLHQQVIDSYSYYIKSYVHMIGKEITSAIEEACVMANIHMPFKFSF